MELVKSRSAKERELFREHSTLINEVLDTLRMKNTVITLAAWCLLLNQLSNETWNILLQLLCTPSSIADLNADLLNEARKWLRLKLETYDAILCLWHTNLRPQYCSGMKYFEEKPQIFAVHKEQLQRPFLLPKSCPEQIDLFKMEPQLFGKKIVEISAQDSPGRIIVNEEVTLVEGVVARLTAMCKGSLQLSEEKWNMLLQRLCTQSSGDDLKVKVDILNALRRFKRLMQELDTNLENSSGAASDSEGGLNHSEDETKEEGKYTQKYKYIPLKYSVDPTIRINYNMKLEAEKRNMLCPDLNDCKSVITSLLDSYLCEFNLIGSKLLDRSYMKSEQMQCGQQSNQRKGSHYYGDIFGDVTFNDGKSEDNTSLESHIPASNTDNRWSRDSQLTSENKGRSRQPSPKPSEGHSNTSTHPPTHSSLAAAAGDASSEVSTMEYEEFCRSTDTSSLDRTHLSICSASVAGSDSLPSNEASLNNFNEDVTIGGEEEEEEGGSVPVQFVNSLAHPQPPMHGAANTVPAPVLLPPSDECCTVIMAASKYSRSLLPIGSRVSCPSRVSSVWSGAGATRGLTVVYGGKEFTAVQSSSPYSHLETWSSLHHYNIQELSAVLGDCPLHRETTYLLIPKQPSECVRSLKEIMVSVSSIIRRLSSSATSKEKELVLKNVKSVLLEVLSGLSFLHSQGLVYGQLSMRHILLDMRCGCGDVFLCPHEAKDSYRVYLADLSSVASEEEEVGLSQQDDVIAFGCMMEELMWRTNTTVAVENQLQVVEKECPELKGLYNVYLSCVRTASSDEVATVQKLVQDLGHLDTTIPTPSPTGAVVPIPPPPPLKGGGVYSAKEETAHENGKESNGKMIVGYFSSLPKHPAVGPTGGNEAVQAVGKPFYVDQSVLVYSSVAVPPVSAQDDFEGSNNRIAVVNDKKMDQKETARGRSTLEGDEYFAQYCEEMKDKMEPPPPEGKVIFSTCAEFTEGSMLPLPSAAAMADTIGKGGNGVVSYVYHMGKEFAVKETCLRVEEMRTLSKLSGQASRNVLPISAVMEGPPLDRYHGRRACYQLMPRATGDVRQMLDRSGSPTLCHYFFKYKPEPAKSSCVLANTRVVLRQALRGLQHLHSKGIVHRDVKLQNILLDMRCGCGDVFLCPHKGKDSYRVYLADFDSALDVERARGKLEERARKGSVLRFTPYGTQGYRAPETSFFHCSNQVLSPEPLSLATRMVLGSAITPYLNPAQDLWSFGCTVLKLFVGVTGPTSQKEVASVLLADCLRRSTQSSSRYQHSVHGRLTVDDEEMKKLLKVSSVKKCFPLAVELQGLIRQCLQVDPDRRPSAEQCAQHQFLRTDPATIGPQSPSLKPFQEVQMYKFSTMWGRPQDPNTHSSLRGVKRKQLRNDDKRGLKALVPRVNSMNSPKSSNGGNTGPPSSTPPVPIATFLVDKPRDVSGASDTL